jgi:hypothetical protein
VTDEKRQIGLRAVSSAREARQRSRFGRMTGPAWLLAGGAVVLTILVAWFFSSRSLANAKEELLARQRAAAQTVGSEWFPLRDKIEGLTIEAAGEFQGDLVAPEASSWDFRSLPGIYLRLRLEDARSVDILREKANESSKDAFTACLMREPNATVAALARGEADAGSELQDQPWNLRRAYAATRVLTDRWIDDVKAAEDPLRLRVFEQQYEQAKEREIPLAIDIIKRAQFYMLVLDEDVPEAAALADGGVIDMDALQQVPHPARVHILNLKTGKELVRLRRTGSADFLLAGEGAVHDPEVRATLRRQVNNCALAQEVWAAVRPGEQAKNAEAAGADAGTN